jgi:hypothetical protein
VQAAMTAHTKNITSCTFPVFALFSSTLDVHQIYPIVTN